MLRAVTCLSLFLSLCLSVLVSCHLNPLGRPHRVAAMYQYLHDTGLARRCIKIGGTQVTKEEVSLCRRVLFIFLSRSVCLSVCLCLVSVCLCVSLKR